MLDSLKAWAARPFNPDMGIWGWVFLFVLFLMVSYAWGGIVKLIEGE
jgi:hypothetical protein